MSPLLRLQWARLSAKGQAELIHQARLATVGARKHLSPEDHRALARWGDQLPSPRLTDMSETLYTYVVAARRLAALVELAKRDNKRYHGRGDRLAEHARRSR